MTWGTGVGVAGILLAIGAWVWYKVRTNQEARDAARIQSAGVELLRDQAQASQTQALQTAQRANEALREEARKVLRVEDPEARKQAALALLHRVRGKL